MNLNNMGRSWADEQATCWLYRRIAFGLVVVAMLFGILFGLAAAHADDAAVPKAGAALPQPPAFVPFVVDEKQDAAARAYLNEMKFRDAAPLWNWLNELEARAKGQWLADNAPKEVPK